MRFAEFMEEYRKNLTDASTLEELLQEAKQNHRVQKLLPIYVLKDKDTFNSMLELANRDSFARKLVAHSRMTVKTLERNKNTKSFGMKRLLGHLANVAGKSLPGDNVAMEEWELNGYSRVLNSYFVANRVFTPFKALRHREKMNSVDWDNLVGTRR